jgi:hypothetical protein
VSAPDAGSQGLLVDAAIRLVEDRPDLPAGAVLRCFSRALLVTRRTGVPAEVLVPQADLVARRLLAVWSRPVAAPRPWASVPA